MAASLVAYGEAGANERETMLLTNHVLSGALIGAVVRRPVPAFVLGIASHFALDTVPHWGPFRGRRDDPDVQAVRWMIEELRVSLFAQTLGTNGPVSEKRIRTALGQLR